ncbi:MAG: hypothetical protein RL026_1679 [Pseudomonadota bacterium]|jgi:uncharacterized MAPEG superfamily protein
MKPVLAVVALALLQFLVFTMLVGRARYKYQCPAPQTTGNEMFERYLRAQMNTLEQLVVFVPAVLIFGYAVHALWAAGLGAVWLLGRTLYFIAYTRDPKSRGVGFALTLLPNLALVFGALWAGLGGLSG